MKIHPFNSVSGASSPFVVFRLVENLSTALNIFMLLILVNMLSHASIFYHGGILLIVYHDHSTSGRLTSSFPVAHVFSLHTLVVSVLAPIHPCFNE